MEATVGLFWSQFIGLSTFIEMAWCEAKCKDTQAYTVVCSHCGPH